MVEIKRILCPIDFSEPSKGAVKHAVASAKWHGAQITLVHVYSALLPWGPLPGIHGDVPTLPLVKPQDVIEELKRFSTSLRLDGSAELAVREGDPAKEIVRLVEEMPADLVVMGTHGRGGFERLVLGSVTEKVLRTTRAPVLTVSTGAEGAAGGPVGYKTILCPLDFSAASMRALQYALSLAKQAGGRLILLHVVEGISDLPRETARFDVAEYGAYLSQDAATQLATIVPDSARREFAVEDHVTMGKAHREILRLAADANADLIVMGVHGKGALHLRVFGSTTHHIIREAGCPVLTLRG